MDVGSLLMGVGGGGILLKVVTAFVDRRKLGADTASVLTKAASGLVQDLEKQIDRLSKKVAELEDQVDSLEARGKSLTADLDAAHDLNRHKDDLIAALAREQEPKTDKPVEEPRESQSR